MTRELQRSGEGVSKNSLVHAGGGSAGRSLEGSCNELAGEWLAVGTLLQGDTGGFELFIYLN